MPTPITGPDIATSVAISGQSGLLSFAGLTSTNRIKTIRDAADTLLELGGSYTPTGTFTNLTLVTPTLGTPASGVATNLTGTADGLTAGDVTRNHAVYAAASPPTVDVGLFAVAKTGVDLKTNATTNIFIVPTGRTFICTKAQVLVTAVTSGGAGQQGYVIRESSASRSMWTEATTASHTPVAGQTTYGQEQITAVSGYSTCTAGNTVQINVLTSHSGSNAVTGTVFATGFYSS